MNTKELFNEIMSFNKNVRSLKWEYAYWGSTIKNWYNQGLPKKNYPIIPDSITTITTSLYLRAWKYSIYGTRENEEVSKKIIELPDGIAVWGNIYRPTQGLPLDEDVGSFFDFDKSVCLLDVEQLFFPHFKIELIEEDDSKITYIDIDGVKRIFVKKESTIPTAVDWPIKGWDSWNNIKEEKLQIDNIKSRFPNNWEKLIRIYKNREYPIAIGGYPVGIFGTLAHLLGYKRLFLLYHDDSGLLRDMLNTITGIWIAIWEVITSEVDIDCLHLWEDVSMGTGSMISPAIFKEFMTPYYKKITSFLKSKRVKNILLDTDGNCSKLIPLFLDAGITGLWPMEVGTGMDLVEIRKKYPDLQIMGGIPKLDISKGKNRIDDFLEPIKWLLKQGGYIPFCDHSVPSEVHWNDFKYYREKLNSIIENRKGVFNVCNYCAGVKK
ncbi:MAG: hypothetical protein FJW68_07190 [Actinobacteria bacterium]|nr:hypothetical protein [Actinomycetota bacterium]